MRNPPLLLLLLLFPPALCDRHDADAESRANDSLYSASAHHLWSASASAGQIRLHSASANVDVDAFGLHNNNSDDDVDVLELAAIPLPPPASVPSWTREWLCDGTAWLVFQLACVYTAKDSGYKDPEHGWLTGGGEHGRDRVRVTVPPPVSRNFTVEHVITLGGGTYTSAVIYFEKGPELDTYYVVCQSSKAQQLPEILSDWSAASPRKWEESGTVISMSDYIAEKSQDLWSSKYNLGQVLLNLAQDLARPQRYIFCGMSHGAALAQVTSLRFRIKLLQQEQLKALPDVYALGWNGYRWTDAKGADMTEAFLGDRSVLLINSMRRDDGKIRTDPVTGYFPENTHVHHRFLLDDEGQVRQCQSTAEQSCPYDIGTGFFGNLQRFSLFSAEKVIRLHPYGQIKPHMLLWMQRECKP